MLQASSPHDDCPDYCSLRSRPHCTPLSYCSPRPGAPQYSPYGSPAGTRGSGSPWCRACGGCPGSPYWGSGINCPSLDGGSSANHSPGTIWNKNTANNTSGETFLQYYLPKFFSFSWPCQFIRLYRSDQWMPWFKCFSVKLSSTNIFAQPNIFFVILGVKISTYIFLHIGYSLIKNKLNQTLKTAKNANGWNLKCLGWKS